MSAGVTIYCDCQGHQVCKSSISTVEQYRDDARNNARTWGWECDERGDYAHGHTPSDTAVSEDQPKPRAEHVHTEACEHRLVSSEVAGVSECYSCGPHVRDQYCPNACPVVLSEVLADSEQVTR